MAARKRARSRGSIRYSTVTNTGPSMTLDLMRHDRLRPVHRWRKVDAGTRLQLPAPGQGNGHKRARGSNELSALQADHTGDLTPDGAASRHGAKKSRHEHRQPAAANPVGQRDLRRYVQGCYGHSPGGAGDDACRKRQRRAARNREQHHRDDRADRSRRDQPIGAQFRFHPAQGERAAHGAYSDDAHITP